MLDGLFDRHGFLHAQSRADARLDLHPLNPTATTKAFHTTVATKEGRWVEIQIRNERMTPWRRGHRGPLALQRRKRGIGRERTVDETPGA